MLVISIDQNTQLSDPDLTTFLQGQFTWDQDQLCNPPPLKIRQCEAVNNLYKTGKHVKCAAHISPKQKQPSKFVIDVILNVHPDLQLNLLLDGCYGNVGVWQCWSPNNL